MVMQIFTMNPPFTLKPSGMSFVSKPQFQTEQKQAVPARRTDRLANFKMKHWVFHLQPCLKVVGNGTLYRNAIMFTAPSTINGYHFVSQVTQSLDMCVWVYFLDWILLVSDHSEAVHKRRNCRFCGNDVVSALHVSETLSG